jgi:hypothetical protein
MPFSIMLSVMSLRLPILKVDSAIYEEPSRRPPSLLAPNVNERPFQTTIDPSLLYDKSNHHGGSDDNNSAVITADAQAVCSFITVACNVTHTLLNKAVDSTNNCFSRRPDSPLAQHVDAVKTHLDVDSSTSSSIFRQRMTTLMTAKAHLVLQMTTASSPATFSDTSGLVTEI